VTLSASLGSAAITLPEARQLAPGDVIVLDRSLEQAIDLTPVNGGPVVACARLADAASPRSLRLEAAAGRNR
jgi:flagellar motor switch protein FliM